MATATGSAIGLSDSAFSKQLTTLEDAGYVTIERQVTNSGVRFGWNSAMSVAMPSKGGLLRCSR